jgi:hypothetical protein
MSEDQCQKEAPLLEQEVAPDLGHSHKQRSRQGKVHGQLGKTGHSARVKGVFGC